MSHRDPDRTVPSPTAAGIIVAGGSGSRFGARQNKALLPLAGRSLVVHALELFEAVEGIGEIVLVVREQDLERAHAEVRDAAGRSRAQLVPGGSTRQASELRGLRHLAGRIVAGEIHTVLIHDAARPLATPALAAAVLRAARRHGGAVPGIESRDLVPAAPEGSAMLRSGSSGVGTRLLRVQTPQGFTASELLAAYEDAERAGFVGTDTASCVERHGTVRIAEVAGEEENLKITFAEDLRWAEHLLAHRTSPVGEGVTSPGATAPGADRASI